MSTLRNDTLKMHKENQGKLSVHSKVPLRNAEDLSLAYSPGVAEPCMEIYEDESKVYDYTMKEIWLLLFQMEQLSLALGISDRKQQCRLWKGKPYYLNPLQM